MDDHSSSAKDVPLEPVEPADEVQIEGSHFITLDKLGEYVQQLRAGVTTAEEFDVSLIFFPSWLAIQE